jgi:hypothetical protein
MRFTASGTSRNPSAGQAQVYSEVQQGVLIPGILAVVFIKNFVLIFKITIANITSLSISDLLIVE